MEYRKRCVDQVISETLDVLGGVLIEGPRGCGKSFTGLHHAESDFRLDAAPENVELARLSPAEILSGRAPVLIDEWQLAPGLWNVVRHEIDRRGGAGHFILCGSSTPTDDITRHTGAGRMGRIRMRPMSLAESHISAQTIRLSDLLSGSVESVSGRSPLSYRDLATCAVTGGWPGLLGKTDRQAQIFTRNYLENLYLSEVFSLLPRHNPLGLSRLMRSLARNLGSSVKQTTLAADVGALSRDEVSQMSRNTVASYLESLARVFIYEPLQPWSIALRSRSRLQVAPKIFFTDPSLAVASLGAGVDRLARDPEYFGQVFESMVIRDLRSYAETLAGKVYYYRDNTGLEVDAIIELPDGTWAGVEVKLGGGHVDEGEANLLKLANERVDVEKVGEPAFLAVVTATEFAMTRPSGVHVIPLACLTW